MRWTNKDRAAAQAQGWDVFDSGERGLEISKLDDVEVEVFADDNATEEFVFDRADAGDALCQKALDIVAATKIYSVRIDIAVNLDYPIRPSQFQAALWDAIKGRIAQGDADDNEDNVTLVAVGLAEADVVNALFFGAGERTSVYEEED